MHKASIQTWLQEEDPDRLEELWTEADRVRRTHVGEEVHLRGLVEISNHCARHCLYCGLRADNRTLIRYRMTRTEILQCALQAEELGYGTIVIQSGEDPGITRKWLCEVIRTVKRETALAVTLSIGERSEEDLRAWREAGADRYLLRFETSDRALFRRIHPSLPGRESDRLAILRTLDTLGYETGSGIMVGIPGQTFAAVAEDLWLFRTLDLDMVGVGPFLPHPGTPLGSDANKAEKPGEEQVPNSALMACKVVALTRILLPLANLPATTALAAAEKGNAREPGLRCGANVIMPNLTPEPYRGMYEIYPQKGNVHTDHRHIRDAILALGRTVAQGRGDSLHYLAKLRDLLALESALLAAPVWNDRHADRS